MQGPRTTKHRRFRLFRKCNCVSCSVKFFSEQQKIIARVIYRKAA